MLYDSTRVIDVLTAVIAAEGDHSTMTTQNVETTNTTAAVAEQGAPVAPEKAASKKARASFGKSLLLSLMMACAPQRTAAASTWRSFG